ncbi:methionyl-tRNA formyltransferase [Patescibacteria group bacterium]|nr:MAG: methionyl-tRNA formyltransferase [Patescibacteria group bacterium]
MKIVFFGTPAFSVPFLLELIRNPEIEVVGVVTQPDKPAGRGGDIVSTPTKLLAHEALIPVFQPSSLKTDQHIGKILKNLDADFFVVVAYGKIIPKTILDIPKLGCINVHPSLLPRHRGPSPMQWAIAQGDVTTGVTIMLLDEGMDTGPLLASEHVTIDADEIYETLVAKVRTIGPQLLTSTLKRFAAGEIMAIKQDESKATLTRLLEKEDGHVDWSQTMEQIDRKHRAYHEWPGTWMFWERKQDVCIRLKINALRPVDFHVDVPRGVATIKESRLFVDCKDGTLEILEIQPEGKPNMKASAFIQGYPDIDRAMMR